MVRGEVGENISEPAYCVKCGLIYQDLRKMFRIDGIDHITGSYYGICGKCALKYSVSK